MKKSELKEIIKSEILNELSNSSPSMLDETSPLNEMAKISGELKTSIEDVINNNPDLTGLPLKKAIKANNNVIADLDGATLYDNQLNKFIALTKGERTVGQRGRKADPNKPKKEANPKAPKVKKEKPTSARGVKKPKSKKSVGTGTSKLGGKKYYAAKKSDDNTQDPDGPSNADLRKLAKSGGSISKDATKKLQQQEKTKKVKEFLKDMKSAGIVDAANRISDKDGYAAAWAIEKPKIDAYIKNLKV